MAPTEQFLTRDVYSSEEQHGWNQVSAASIEQTAKQTGANRFRLLSAKNINKSSFEDLEVKLKCKSDQHSGRVN